MIPAAGDQRERKQRTEEWRMFRVLCVGVDVCIIVSGALIFKCDRNRRQETELIDKILQGVSAALEVN